jgi:hypothetical protein
MFASFEPRVARHSADRAEQDRVVLLIAARSASVSVSPVSRNACAQREARLLEPDAGARVAASSTFSASAITSGPMPSPG